MSEDKQCIVCPQYGRDPELCERYPVCEQCRTRLSHGLAQVPQQWATLTAEPGIGATERISGTRDKPLGVRVSALDQMTPVPPTLAARLAIGYDDHLIPKVETWYETQPVRELDRDTLDVVEVEREVQHKAITYSGRDAIEVHPSGVGRFPRQSPEEWVEAGDQAGEIPVAAWLDSCVRDWMTYNDQWKRLPVPTVERLTGWLAVRLEWACDSHPAVDEFAAELRHAIGVLRAVNGDVHAKPEVKIGVICKGCDAKSSLRREAGDDYIECEDCGYLYSPQEYEDWTRMLHGYAKQHYRWDRENREWVLNEEEGAA